MASAASPKEQDRGTRARRHNHALVALGRRVWHEDCTFDTASAAICEVAADTLEIERREAGGACRGVGGGLEGLEHGSGRPCRRWPRSYRK